MQTLKQFGRRIKEVTIGGRPVAVSESPIGFLGRVLWYSVFELHVPHEEFFDLLERAKVPEDLWPSKTRPVDAFKKAVRARESTEYIVVKDIVEGKEGRETIPNSLVVARRVRELEISDIPVLVRAKYEGEDIIMILKDGALEEAEKIAKAIKQDFERFKATFDATDIRGFLNQAVKSAYPIQLKSSGGVYFVPEQYGELMESLAMVMDDIGSMSHGTEFITLPVVDRQPERATIMYKYETETTARLKELAERAVEWHKEGRELYPSQFARFQDEYEWLLKQRLQYEDLLEEASVSVETELGVLKMALTQLSESVKEKEGES